MPVDHHKCLKSPRGISPDLFLYLIEPMAGCYLYALMEFEKKRNKGRSKEELI